MTEMREDLARIEGKKEYKTELVNINSKLDSLDIKQDGFNMSVMRVSSKLVHNMLNNVTEELKKTADYILEELLHINVEVQEKGDVLSTWI